MKRYRVMAAIVGLCLAGAACDDTRGIVSAPPSIGKASLDAFADCDEALAHLKAQALPRVTPWGLSENHWIADQGESVTDTTLGWSPPTTNFGTTVTTQMIVGGQLPITSGPDLPGFSNTNVQVMGVDEPDVVKTDGSTLYRVRNGRLDVVDIRTAGPHLLGSFDLPGHGHQILLYDNRIVVIETGEWDSILRDVAEQVRGFSSQHSSYSRLTELDVSRPEAISVTRTATIEGLVVGARLVGDQVRAVIDFTPGDFPFVSPRGGETALATNRQIIEDSTIEQWLPVGSVTVDGWTKTGPAVDCAQLHAPNLFSGFGQAIVFTLDLNDRSAELGASAVLGQASMLYSTATSLYLATNDWIDRSQLGSAADEHYTTVVHAFDTPVNGTVDYLGSGRVRGHALDQFSLDEHKGALRVVTTIGAPWSGNSESMVSVMQLVGDELKVVGSVGGLGKGERVQSVRFAGDRGYVVTFRQIDPFYTLDLSDERNPRVLGELKIPGFSSYLHPISGDRVIGVGSDADLNGRVTGLLVSLFDVTNPASPQQVSSITVDNANSNISFDHHAFLYWPETSLLVVPVNSWVDNYTGAMALRVESASITEIDLVQHIDPANRYALPTPIERSLVAQGSLITTSGLGIKVNDLNDLSDRGWLGLSPRTE